MVNPIGGPGPIDETERTASADLSSRGIEASAANKSAEAEKIAGTKAKPEEPKTDSVGRWSLLRSARNSLMNLLDRLSAAFTSTRASATGATSGTAPTPTFDDYKTQAESAYNTILTSTSLPDVEAALVSLQNAVDNMKKTASTDEEKAIASDWEVKNTQAIQVGAQIKELAKYLSDNEDIYRSLETLTSFDLLQAALQQAVMNNEQAAQLLKEMQDNPVIPGKTPAIAQSLVDQTSAQNDLIQQDGGLIRNAYYAAQNANGAVEEAKANNSQNNVDAAKASIAAAKTRIEEALKKFPNSSILKDAQALVNQAEKELKNIKPADGSDVPNPGATVGSSQQNTNTVGNMRVAMLLDDAANESASILLSGFRQMIHMFNTQNPDAKAAEQELGAQAGEAAAAGKTDAAQALLGAQKALQEALGKAAQQEGILNALGKIASAAVVSSGVAPASASTIGSSVKQLYKTSQSSGKDYKSQISAGYEAYKTINNAYANARNNATRDVINNVSTPALTRSVPRPRTEARGAEKADQSVARMISEGSSTLGDVYGQVSALESVMSMIQSNFQANNEEIKKKLTSAVTKPPQFGYPYIQISDDSTQKFIAKLESLFAEGSRTAAEIKALSFETNSSFIQQVLVNIGSLYASYLQ
ncbi:hypothetical protein C10C_0699 [Chlamydia serpentis]|uniref:Uncharacterized protein n=1 Tax=Chlamydia serpentis TaxID=1967782 RepID=A0A2R8FC01_9CHLA|nr:hypothetical protein [Chlamydia serpentis]SPN73846.1 hypothetical protein C10C_0699 [Chlamydia serpentis]